MCGIIGAIDCDTSECAFTLDEGSFRKLVARMRHRGPDAEGFWAEDGVLLGHRRLSILDLSDAGIQPMSDPSGRYHIVYNGEVYNYEEVKRELSNHDYKSTTDTEVILAAYIEWGASCVARLNGMFAFAIWDSLSRELFLARDRFGIKPLYYYISNRSFRFASEIRTLRLFQAAPDQLDESSVLQYLQYYSVNSPLSIVDKIFQLRAGHYGVYNTSSGRLEEVRYWSLFKVRSSPQASSRSETVRKIRELMGDAVERQLISDVPLGAFLSGGIDSSAIVALMAERSRRPVHTFSVGFNEEAYDESRWAKIVVEKYSTQHHSVLLRPEDFLEQLPAALAAMDHPTGDGLNSYVVSCAAKKAGFTVALSGLGGDELFAGYHYFKRYYLLNKLHLLYKLPISLRKTLGDLQAKFFKTHKSDRLRQLFYLPSSQFSDVYPVLRQISTQSGIESLLQGNLKQSKYDWSAIYTESDLIAINKLPIYSQVTVGELSTYTQNVLLRDTDQMSMAHSLEVRVPFFDNDLVDYVLAIPDCHKFSKYPKQLLVEALGDLLPSQVVHRKKMGFNFPWEQWMRGALRDFCGEKINTLAEHDLFDGPRVVELWKKFENRDPGTHWMQLWLLVVLQSWLEGNQMKKGH